MSRAAVRAVNMRKWRNWQTRTFEGRVIYIIRVQVPFSASSCSFLLVNENGLQLFVFLCEGIKMSKKLSEMTLEELWELFPIYLTEHNSAWKQQYEKMAAFLKEKLSPCHIIRVSHIGSTAINDIWAKPIVDILVELAPDEDIAAVAERITDSGFLKMAESEGRISLNYGYTENGFAENVYHLHLRYAGDNDELYFRDYLNDNPAIAGEYERLKLHLWHQYEHDRDGYTEAKVEFVKKRTTEAKKRYKNRYV